MEAASPLNIDDCDLSEFLKHVLPTVAPHVLGDYESDLILAECRKPRDIVEITGGDVEHISSCHLEKLQHFIDALDQGGTAEGKSKPAERSGSCSPELGTPYTPWQSEESKYDTDDETDDKPIMPITVPTNLYKLKHWDTPFDRVEEPTLKEKLMTLEIDKTENHNQILDLLGETFGLQRHEINSCSCVKDLRNEWPHLFAYACLMDHCDNLCGYDIRDSVDEALTGLDKGKRIFNYLSTSTMLPSYRLSSWLTRIRRHKELLCTPFCRGLPFIVLAHFGEKEQALFRFYQVKDDELCDVLAKDERIPDTPFVALLGEKNDVFADNACAHVVIEKQVVTRQPLMFWNGFTYLLASFYVLNIPIPQETQLTLTFFQREILVVKETLMYTPLRQTTHPALRKFVEAIQCSESEWN